ncbi:MAG TPA: DUF3488 and transglutaminase-like domain-containing protein, partial [Noviherbaspirillum sp.]
RPTWVVPVCALIMGWRAWITFSGNRLPPRWLLWPVALLAIAGVALTFRTILGREAGVTMLALLLALKLLEIHVKRDLFVVLFLCFFLILAAFFHSQSIGTAALALAAIIAILTTQASFQYTGTMPPLLARLRLGAAIVGLALPLTVVLFVLFPRIQGPLWGLPSDAHSARTGLSDTMEPGNISNLAQSDAIAFRARFEGPPPAREHLYWRGIVLGDYDGRTWRPVREMPNTTVRIVPQGEAVRYQVTLEPHGKRWLFLLDVPARLPQLDGQTASISSDLQLLAALPINNRIRYDAASHVDYLLQSDESAAAMRRWLALPAGFNPRAQTLAASLRKAGGNDVPGMIASVLQMFREQPFRYTLEPPRLGTHVVDEFLFETRAGFCEHYAGAFVVLMRAMDIPARVVTGYQGGEINPTDGYMAVRQSDAHAWAEVWIADRGWVRIDPTAAVAPERVERNLSSVIPPRALGGLITFDAADSVLGTQLLRLRHAWEAMNNSWNQWVLNYTPERQRDFLRRLGLGQADWKTLALLTAAFSIAAAAIMLALLALRQQRRDPLVRLYERFCTKMARRRLPRQPHEGPRDYAARLSAASSALNEREKTALQRFLALYEEMRYGVAPQCRAALSNLKSLLNQIR